MAVSIGELHPFKEPDAGQLVRRGPDKPKRLHLPHRSDKLDVSPCSQKLSPRAHRACPAHDLPHPFSIHDKCIEDRSLRFGHTPAMPGDVDSTLQVTQPVRRCRERPPDVHRESLPGPERHPPRGSLRIEARYPVTPDQFPHRSSRPNPGQEIILFPTQHSYSSPFGSASTNPHLAIHCPGSLPINVNNRWYACRSRFVSQGTLL